MKNNIFFITLIVIAITISSCAKEDSLNPSATYDPEATGDNSVAGGGTTGGTVGTGSTAAPYMAADIDGVRTIFQKVIWNTEIDPANNANNENIDGIMNGTTIQQLFFAMERPVVAGMEYEIDLFNNVAGFRPDTVNDTPANTFLAFEGKIKVTAFDVAANTFNGTFNFVLFNNSLTDSVVVSNGVFNMKK